VKRVAFRAAHDADGLVERHGPARAPFLPAFRGVDQRGHVAHDLVACLRAADRPAQDGVDDLHGPRRQVPGAVFEPVFDVVGGEFLELPRADERDEVGLGKALVVVDRLGGQALGSPGEPVTDGLLDRVVIAGLDARLEVSHDLPELVLHRFLGLGFPRNRGDFLKSVSCNFRRLMTTRTSVSVRISGQPGYSG
jgi:hypothetical protein